MKDSHITLVEGGISKVGARLLHWLAEYGQGKIDMAESVASIEPYNNIQAQAAGHLGWRAGWQTELNKDEYLGYAVQAIVEDWLQQPVTATADGVPWPQFGARIRGLDLCDPDEPLFLQCLAGHSIYMTNVVTDKNGATADFYADTVDTIHTLLAENFDSGDPESFAALRSRVERR